MKVDRHKVLRKKIKTKITQRVEARGRGANPAYKKRDLNYAKVWPGENVAC